jgi:hypothetical protein
MEKEIIAGGAANGHTCTVGKVYLERKRNYTLRNYTDHVIVVNAIDISRRRDGAETSGRRGVTPEIQRADTRATHSGTARHRARKAEEQQERYLEVELYSKGC